MEQPILEGLIAYNNTGSYPWHMPGHKRRLQTIFPELVNNPFSIDVTEVGNLDEFHHPEGMIKEAFERATDIYGSQKSYYLVNGSTCGILAAISAVCKQGDTILVARNCHKSVYQAIRLLRLKPIYLLPDWNEKLGMFGGVSVDAVKKALKEHTSIRAMILVSPTFEGVVSDIERIAKLLHKYKLPLIVDEAHGAHFEYMANVNETILDMDYKKIPSPAIRLGADIVVESLHKTLPAMTQCSILHFKSNYVRQERLEEFLSIYQTTSPSYVFLASTEACIERMDHERDGLFIIYKKLLADYRKLFALLSHIHLVGEEDFKKNSIYGYDDGKLVFSVKNCGITTDVDGEEKLVPLNGVMLGRMLEEEYGQMMEMAGGDYVIAMTSVADTKEAFEALYQALSVIDSQITELETDTKISYSHIPEQRIGIAEAKDSDYSLVSFMEAAGRVSGDYVYVYPPGIPIVTPGEVISRELVKDIQKAMACEMNVKGVKGTKDAYMLTVLRDKDRQIFRKKWLMRETKG